MLCRLTEGGVCKCARYWPETTSDVAKDSDAGFEIKLLSEEVSIERNFFNSTGSSIGVPPRLIGFICAFHPAAPGSSPKHTTYAMELHAYAFIIPSAIVVFAM